jgi:hypothetical protein
MGVNPHKPETPGTHGAGGFCYPRHCHTRAHQNTRQRGTQTALRHTRTCATPSSIDNDSVCHRQHTHTPGPRIDVDTRTPYRRHNLPCRHHRRASIDTRAPYGATTTPSPHGAPAYPRRHDRRVMRVAGLVRVGGLVWSPCGASTLHIGVIFGFQSLFVMFFTLEDRFLFITPI